MRGWKLVGIGRLTQLLDLYELGLAQIKKILFKFRIEHVISFG